MRMRRSYGRRRERLRRSIETLFKSSSRRERKRKGRISSINALKAKWVNYYQEEQMKDFQNLDEITAGNREDLIQALVCLKEATVYMDLMIKYPDMVGMGTPRYRKWSTQLDSFLMEMRDLVDYRKKPGQHSLEVEETLTRRLQEMKLHEDHAPQREVRFKLEEAMDKLFEPRPPSIEMIRKRLMGL